MRPNYVEHCTLSQARIGNAGLVLTGNGVGFPDRVVSANKDRQAEIGVEGRKALLSRQAWLALDGGAQVQRDCNRETGVGVPAK